MSTLVDASLYLSLGGHPVEEDAREPHPLVDVVQDVDVGDGAVGDNVAGVLGEHGWDPVLVLIGWRGWVEGSEEVAPVDRVDRLTPVVVVSRLHAHTVAQASPRRPRR